MDGKEGGPQWREHIRQQVFESRKEVDKLDWYINLDLSETQHSLLRVALYRAAL